jgi:hypothetical protein
MGKKITIDEKTYDLDDFSDNARAQLASLQFTMNKLSELNNMQALLTRAKNSYMESVKKEILADKAGIVFD